MFRCNSCGRDTLTQAHRLDCPVLLAQNKRKSEELGIPFNPNDYQLPLRLDDP